MIKSGEISGGEKRNIEDQHSHASPSHWRIEDLADALGCSVMDLNEAIRHSDAADRIAPTRSVTTRLPGIWCWSCGFRPTEIGLIQLDR
jgi:hypothetical protein